MLFVWAVLFLVLYGVGWFFVGLASGRGCSDAAAWDEPVTALCGLMSAVLAALLCLL